MEQYLGQSIAIFLFGALVGAALVLIFNRVRSGSVSPGKLRKEYDQYQSDVESHFEETSKKFQAMTNQYQDLYRHLSVGATSLCRPDSVAAGLADQSDSSKQAPLLDKATPFVDQAQTKADAKVDAKASSEASNDVEQKASTEKPTAQANADAVKKTESEAKAAVEKSAVSSAVSKVNGRHD